MKKPSLRMLPGIAIGLAVALVGTGAAAQSAPPAGAMQSVAPRRPANQAMTQPGQFVLNGDSDVELVRFSTPHDMLVCLPPRMDVHGRPDLQGPELYPIVIAWDDEVGEVWPGDCLGFDAAKVTVRPSPAMPSGDHVVGQVYLF